MQWWRSARGIPWSWTWQPYPGVWLLILIISIGYFRLYRRAGISGRARPSAAIAGIGIVWLTLDWPIGALGSGYLLSLHMVQFMTLAFAAPPLLLFGLPPGCERQLSPRITAVFAQFLRPARAWIAFNVVVILTQLPAVVDSLMASQVGSFVLDLTWILAGLAFWWPVARRWPEPALGAPWQLLYVLSGIMVHMASGLVFAQVPYPLYRTYEFAPPIPGVNSVDDQFQAGGLMTTGDVLVGLVAVAFLLYAWWREEQAQHAARDLLEVR